MWQSQAFPKVSQVNLAIKWNMVSHVSPAGFSVWLLSSCHTTFSVPPQTGLGFIYFIPLVVASEMLNVCTLASERGQNAQTFAHSVH